MYYNLESMLVDCLSNTVHVMLCSESTLTISKVQSQICRFPLVSFYKVRTLELLDLHLKQVKMLHCIIIDSHSANVDKFIKAIQIKRRWVPIIFLSDELSDEFINQHKITHWQDIHRLVHPDENTERLRTRLFDKNIILCDRQNFGKLVSLVQYVTILRKLLNRIPQKRASDAIAALFKNNPLSVDDWTLCINSTPRKFQRLFKHYSDYAPKKILTLYHAYRIAYLFTSCITNDNFKSPVSTYILNETSKKRVLEYVLSRRTELLT